jgi:hypothetical protein
MEWIKFSLEIGVRRRIDAALSLLRTIRPLWPLLPSCILHAMCRIQRNLKSTCEIKGLDYSAIHYSVRAHRTIALFLCTSLPISFICDSQTLLAYLLPSCSSHAHSSLYSQAVLYSIRRVIWTVPYSVLNKVVSRVRHPATKLIVTDLICQHVDVRCRYPILPHSNHSFTKKACKTWCSTTHDIASADAEQLIQLLSSQAYNRSLPRLIWKVIYRTSYRSCSFCSLVA